jgi:ABC-type branched-subunit amino acid transport system permease subunit
MTKLIGLLLILAMAVHLIKPMGLPGLRRRGDFWKIAVAAFGIWTVALAFREIF